MITLNSGQKISLPDLITRSIATIQSGRFIEQWPLQARLLGFACIILLALSLYRLSRLKVLIWGCILAFLYAGASVLIFSNTLLWTPPFASISLFITLILIGVILPHMSAHKLSSVISLSDTKSGNVS